MYLVNLKINSDPLYINIEKGNIKKCEKFDDLSTITPDMVTGYTHPRCIGRAFREMHDPEFSFIFTSLKFNLEKELGWLKLKGIKSFVMRDTSCLMTDVLTCKPVLTIENTWSIADYSLEKGEIGSEVTIKTDRTLGYYDYRVPYFTALDVDNIKEGFAYYFWVRDKWVKGDKEFWKEVFSILKMKLMLRKYKKNNGLEKSWLYIEGLA